MSRLAGEPLERVSRPAGERLGLVSGPAGEQLGLVSRPAAERVIGLPATPAFTQATARATMV